MAHVVIDSFVVNVSRSSWYQHHSTTMQRSHQRYKSTDIQDSRQTAKVRGWERGVDKSTSEQKGTKDQLRTQENTRKKSPVSVFSSLVTSHLLMRPEGSAPSRLGSRRIGWHRKHSQLCSLCFSLMIKPSDPTDVGPSVKCGSSSLLVHSIP